MKLPAVETKGACWGISLQPWFLLPCANDVHEVHNVHSACAGANKALRVIGLLALAAFYLRKQRAHAGR